MTKLSPWKQYLVGFLAVIIALLISVTVVFHLSMKPRSQARATAFSVAKKHASLQTMSRFDLYHGSSTYYTVFGKTKDGQEKIVLIGEADKKVYVYDASEGISRTKAQAITKKNGAKNPDKVLFGYSEDNPIWEVRATNGYYLINFKTGELMKREGL